MIIETVPNIETMSPGLFRSRAGAPGRVGTALAKLHSAGVKFQSRFELFATIEDYLSVLSTKDVVLPDGYDDVVTAAAPIKEMLAQADLPSAPRHCDPLCENFLDDAKVMWIVDWEYSGMNDPFWDLGGLSVEAEMDAEQDTEMMMAYFGRDPSDAELGRMVIYKTVCDLQWTLCGLIQLANDNPPWISGLTPQGGARCKALMQRERFHRHIDAVRAG